MAHNINMNTNYIMKWTAPAGASPERERKRNKKSHDSVSQHNNQIVTSADVTIFVCLGQGRFYLYGTGN